VRRAHGVGVAAEPHQGEHPLPDLQAGDPGTEGVDDAGHLVPHDARRLRRIRIEALPGHHLREVQPGGANGGSGTRGRACRMMGGAVSE
jgi:hypothetical protein